MGDHSLIIDNERILPLDTYYLTTSFLLRYFRYLARQVSRALTCAYPVSFSSVLVFFTCEERQKELLL